VLLHLAIPKRLPPALRASQSRGFTGASVSMGAQSITKIAEFLRRMQCRICGAGWALASARTPTQQLPETD